MILNIPFQADLQAIQQQRQLLINSNLLRTNAEQHKINYKPGQQVLLKDS